MIIAIPIIRSRDNILYVSPHFGKAPYFLLVDLDSKDNKYKILDLIENKYFRDQPGGEKGRRITELLLSHNVKIVITSEIGPGAFYRVRDAGIEIYLAKPMERVEVVLEQFMRGELEKALEPTEEEHEHH